MFLQLLANGLVTGSVIAIAAVGVSLVYEILRIVNFAHGDYLAFGTFVGVAANVRYGERMLVATIAAIAATAAARARVRVRALAADAPARRGLHVALHHLDRAGAPAAARALPRRRRRAAQLRHRPVQGLRDRQRPPRRQSGHRARRRGERDRARRPAARPDRPRPQDACARGRPCARLDLGRERRSRRRLHLGPRRRSGRPGRSASGARPGIVHAQHRLPAPAADLRGGRARGNRQRVRRARGRPAPRRGDGALDLGGSWRGASTRSTSPSSPSCS